MNNLLSTACLPELVLPPPPAMPGLGSIRTFRGHRGWEKFKLYFVGFSHLPFVPPGPLRLLDHYECQTLATMLIDFLKEALEC